MLSEADNILISTSPSQKVELNAIENLVCGFITGTCTRTLTSPFDVVKILLQVNSKGGSVGETISKLWREDGIAAFWRGNLVGCLNQGPQSALKFLVLEYLKKMIGKEHLSGGERAFMGACAGIVSQTCVYPVEFIHTRILLDPKKYHGVFQTAATIISEEGITAFWSGIAPTIAGAIPFEGSQFFTYDGLAQLYKEKVAHSQTISPAANCVVGAIAGAISQTVAFPFDVVRKRMMAGQKMGGNLPTTMGGAFKHIYQNEGIGGFFKGLSVNMVKIVPYSALQYTIFAETKKAVLKYKVARLQKTQAGKKGK